MLLLLETGESYDPDLCLPIYHLWETTSGVPFVVDSIMVFHFSLFLLKEKLTAHRRDFRTHLMPGCLVVNRGSQVDAVKGSWGGNSGYGDLFVFNLFYLNNVDLC